MLQKFIKDFISYQFSHLLGGRSFDAWQKDIAKLHKASIKNTLLATEFEKACHMNGIIPYAEFLTLDQFSTYGYHNTHKNNGMTDVVTRWPKALVALCQQKGFHHIVEFGPGDGRLGVFTLFAAQKKNYPIFWSGVEINQHLQDQIKKHFTKNKLQKNLFQLVSRVEELHLPEKCLFVYSYSLDNLAPDVFINTSQSQQAPNAMIGVTVKNGVLSEKLLSKKDIEKLGYRLNKNIFTDTFGYHWNLQQWQLHPMQRAYLQLSVFRTLIETVNTLPLGSQLLIIDEFRTAQTEKTYHFGLPKDLETFTRDFTNFEKFYKTAGSNLIYFPLYLTAVVSFFSQIGLPLEENKGEHQLAYALSNTEKPYPQKTHTYALLSSPKTSNTTNRQFNFLPPAGMIKPTLHP